MSISASESIDEVLRRRCLDAAKCRVRVWRYRHPGRHFASPLLFHVLSSPSRNSDGQIEGQTGELVERKHEQCKSFRRLNFLEESPADLALLLSNLRRISDVDESSTVALAGVCRQGPDLSRRPRGAAFSQELRQAEEYQVSSSGKSMTSASFPGAQRHH